MADPREPKHDDDDIEQGKGYSMPPSDPAGPASDDEDELGQGLGYSAPAVTTPDGDD